ncbi:Putative matrix metalloproteinase 095L, partial [Acromyrmex echinatior]
IHVDAAERWHIYLTEKSASKKDYLLNMLTHEIGHALGLTYSSREDSIMFAYVTANNKDKIVRLNIEDILAIQQLYGDKNPNQLYNHRRQQQQHHHQLSKLHQINPST